MELGDLTLAVEAGNRARAVELTTEAITAGIDPRETLASMTAAMDTIGGRFQRNEIFVPEMLIAARAMKDAMAILEPQLADVGARPEHTAVIGTVAGDLHDIGKNLVAMMWKGANLAVIDLGVNVSPESFVAAIKEHDARLVGISALLTTTMANMKSVVDAIREAGLGDVKVMIGGAPVTAEFAREVGADGFAADAGAAVDVARQVLAVGNGVVAA